eukprot:42136_1
MSVKNDNANEKNNQYNLVELIDMSNTTNIKTLTPLQIAICSTVNEDQKNDNKNIQIINKAKLIQNKLFWSRICSLFLTLLLCLLSFSYCWAQILNVKLKIVSVCDDPPSREQIWKHSFEYSVEHSPNQLTSETQYGLNADQCWTTNRVQINTDNIWNKNYYTLSPNHPINSQMFMFGLISVYCTIIIIFNIITLSSDMVSANKNLLHTKSPLYKEYEKANNIQQIQISTKQNESRRGRFIRRVKTFDNKHCSPDTTGWIVMMCSNEIIEIILQSQALLLYNGINLFDWNNENDIYLANKPQFIILFASIITFNCVGSATLWLFYCFLSKYCYG